MAMWVRADDGMMLQIEAVFMAAGMEPALVADGIETLAAIWGVPGYDVASQEQRHQQELEELAACLTNKPLKTWHPPAGLDDAS